MSSTNSTGLLRSLLGIPGELNKWTGGAFSKMSAAELVEELKHPDPWAALFDVAVGHKDPAVRIAAASHPKLPSKLLVDLVSRSRRHQETNPAVRKAAKAESDRRAKIQSDAFMAWLNGISEKRLQEMTPAEREAELALRKERAANRPSEADLFSYIVHAGIADGIHMANNWSDPKNAGPQPSLKLRVRRSNNPAFTPGPQAAPPVRPGDRRDAKLTEAVTLLGLRAGIQAAKKRL